MIDATEFRNGMAPLTGAVDMVTTDGPAGRAGWLFGIERGASEHAAGLAYFGRRYHLLASMVEAGATP